MLEFQHASYSYYPGVWILRDVTLNIVPGLTLVLGPNGSGKSTLLKLAAGVERPDEGSVAVDGFDLWRDEVKSRMGLAYVPEQPDLTPYATIDEILHLVCRLRRVPLSVVRERLVEVGLQDYAGRTVRELSMGQRRRAVLAAAMIGSVRNLVLDEPLEAMDRDIQEKMLAWIAAHLATGSSIVMATHDFQPFLEMVSRVITPVDGRLTLIESLPADRFAFLDKSARGKV